VASQNRCHLQTFLAHQPSPSSFGPQYIAITALDILAQISISTYMSHRSLHIVAPTPAYLTPQVKMAASDPTMKPRSNYHPSHTVILLVGKEQQEMLVHTNIISAHSAFFRAALKKEWKEGQTHVIRLPEDDPDIVTRYLDFVYHDRLVTQYKSQPDSNYIDLALLYVYGERVLDIFIQNTIIEHLLKLTDVINRNHHGHRHYPGPAVVEIIYEGTAKCWSICMRAMVRRNVLLTKTFTLRFAWMLRALSWLRPWPRMALLDSVEPR
jgi:hypothetical protein